METSETWTNLPAGPRMLAMARGMRLLILGYALDMACGTLISGAFSVGYARWLGANNRHLGLLSAIPSLLSILYLVTTYLAERVRNRKRYVLIVWTAGYLVWIPMILIPYTLPPGWRIWAFLAGIAAMHLFFVLPGGTYLAWISEIVPEKMRGRFFGRRNLVGGWLAMLVSVIGGRYIDVLGERGGFVYVFSAAVLLGIGFLVTVALLPPPRGTRAAVPPRFIEVFRQSWRNLGLRRLLVFMGVYNLSLTLAGPFYSLFLLERLRMPYSMIQLCASLFMLTNLATTPFWGYLIDRYGCNAVLRLSGLALAAALPFWIAAEPERLWLIFAAHFIAGLIMGGLNLAPMNLLLKLGTEAERQMFNGFYYGCNAVGSTIAPLLGAWIMDAAQSWQGSFLGLTLDNYRLLFALALLLRLVGPLFLSLAPEPGEVPAHRLAWQLLSSSPLSTFFHLFRLRATRDVTARAEAERRLGLLRSSLAVEDLAAGLRDPSPLVRREAVRALGEIGDEQAVTALLDQIQQDEEDLLPEILEALGKTGDPRALPPLLEMLRDPTQDRTVRRTAALALASFDTPEVRSALLELLGSEASPRLAAAAADSLGQLREWRALDLIYARLATEQSEPGRGQLANALARLVGDDALLYMLLKATPLDREVAVDRLLRSLIRRCQRRWGLPQAAVWLQETLTAYQQGDLRTAGQRLALVGRHLAATRPDDFQQPVAAARLALLELLQEASGERDLGPEEILLGMVTVREMLHRLSERG